jgi:casein kinase 1
LQGTNLLNNEPVAVKFEPRKTDAPQLRDEYRTYKILYDQRKYDSIHFYMQASISSCAYLTYTSTPSPSAGIPSAYYYGQEGMHNILVIDLLGPSLEDVFDKCGRMFSVKTVAMLAKDMVS